MSPILRCWGVRLGLAGVVVGGGIAFGSTTLAQVVPDSTLGGENSVVTSTDSVDAISGGATRGGNLFHSLDQFSIPTGREVFFNNAANIQNILTRVTGGSISNVDGLIQANGTANLFLLNPNGIIFGQNASLNIGGSFIATTASSINFADGTQFSATPGTGAPLLTVSVPLGLQFGAGAGNIDNRASTFGLQVGAGKTLGLIGGNVSLDGGYLTAAGGRIELGGVGAPGVVGINPDNSGFRFSFPTDLALADISLTNTALVDTRAGGGGSIAVNTRNLSLTGGSIIAAGIYRNQGSASAVAGDLDINAQGNVTIDGVGEFSDGVYSSGLFNDVETGSTGRGGNINVKAGSVSLTDGAALNVSNFGQGDAGSIFLQADDSISLSNSNILSNVSGGAIGNGGTVSIKANSLSLTKGSQIISAIGDGTDSLPGGRGNGGNVSIDVRNFFSADGRNSDGFSSAVFTSVGSGAEGNGGNVSIKTGSLSFANGAFISAGTSGQGNAGNVIINASDAVSFDGIASGGFSSGVFSNVREGGFGNGGIVEVNANSLSLTDGAQIITSVFGVGNAGNINIEANDTIFVEGINNEGFPSGIFSAVEGGGRGNGGSINVKARSLFLTNNGRLITSSFGQGNAGNIDVNVRTLELDYGGIFAESALGDGGNIQLQASKSLTLRDGSFISTRSRSGGNLTINSPLIIASYNGDNDIVTNALFGRGGQLGITAESIIGLTSRNFQELQSLAGTSDPTVLVDFLSSLPSNDVASISSNPVVINTAEIFLNPNLAELPTTPVDASTLVASGCPSGAENRFTVAGRGGLPPAPRDKFSTDALLTDWATLTTPETDSRAAEEKAIPEAANTTIAPLVEATTWQFGSKGEIILTNADPAAPNQFEATPSNCPSS